MSTVYLGLGTNLGDKEVQLRTAVNEIEKRIGRVMTLSAFYTTIPWGFTSEHTFLNAACAVETSLNPYELLSVTQDIEKNLGRKHKSVDHHYTDRLIDIDILFFDEIIIHEPGLQIPHPLLTKRDFVLKPLVEIAPDLVHPINHLTIRKLWQRIN
ncbi:MAG: 2-amino-4-hydroxy-6-hydroxymethyldihydropteridine diphosphokinase [Phocaeicola sp.]|nr:2-amino-4-hydroxy-6-hydroxymethyldihydropteridine diphosphokinase [Phocaeicola sp.]